MIILTIILNLTGVSITSFMIPSDFQIILAHYGSLFVTGILLVLLSMEINALCVLYHMLMSLSGIFLLSLALPVLSSLIIICPAILLLLTAGMLLFAIPKKLIISHIYEV